MINIEQATGPQAVSPFRSLFLRLLGPLSSAFPCSLFPSLSPLSDRDLFIPSTFRPPPPITTTTTAASTALTSKKYGSAAAASPGSKPGTIFAADIAAEIVPEAPSVVGLQKLQSRRLF